MSALTYEVFGTKISIKTATELAECIEAWAAAPDQVGHVVCFSDTNGVVQGHDNPSMRHALATADIVAADGHPIAWVGRTLFKLPARTNSGPDFLTLLASRSPASGLRHYLFGGKPGVANELAEVLQNRFPGIVIAGTDSPPMGPSSDLELEQQLGRINATQPHVVWVGLGAPKQEVWMAHNRHRLPGITLCGVGAAFDFHTGRVQRAPAWMSRHGLEWIFRWCSEPRRLGPRYRKTIVRFLVLLDAQASRMVWQAVTRPKTRRAANPAEQ